MSAPIDSHGNHPEGHTVPESGVTTPTTRRRGGIGLLVAYLLLACFAYRDLIRVRLRHGAAVELENWFFVSDDTSPAVVVAMSAWLLFRRWGRWSELTPATSWASLLTGAGVGVLGVAVAAWAYYTLSSDLLAPSLALVGLGAATLAWGRGGAKTAFLPALFLLFAIQPPGPLLNELAFRLQIWTAHYTGLLLYFFDLPAVVSGDQILRKSATFMVIENCSGLRSIETLSMLTLLMIDLFDRRRLHALLLLLCAPPVAFALNGFRVLLLIVNPHSDVTSIHNLQGIAMLLGGLGLIYCADLILFRVLSVVAERTPGHATEPTGVAGMGLGRRHGVIAMVLVAVAAVSWWMPSHRRPIPPLISLSQQFPVVMGSWDAVDLEIDSIFLGTLAFQESLYRRYREPGGIPVDLFVGLGNHSSGMRGPLSPKTAVPGSGWVIEDLEPVFLGDGRTAEMRVVRSVATRRLLYHWVSGHQGWLSEVLRAGLRLEQSPWSRERDSLTLRISTSLETAAAESRAEARERIERFLTEFQTRLQALEGRMERKKFSRKVSNGKTISQTSSPS